MRTLWFIRIFFFIISGVVGYYVGSLVQKPNEGLLWGLGMAVIFIFGESALRRVSVRGLSSVVFGLLLGVFMANLLSDILSLLPLEEYILSASRVVLTLVFSYLGAMMALRGKDEFNIIIPYVRFKRQDVKQQVILLDTSAIIDGRVGEIYKTKFLSGRLVVPYFILLELQALADSHDASKRAKGRRGLELVKIMREDPAMDLKIHDDDIEEKDTDKKLVRLAKLLEASICTTDFNLNRVAALQNIEVLNINDLMKAAKMLVMPEEELDVKLVKEGKESNQAIGYLEDGTMIVVMNAKDFIGQSKKVKITSVLQTQAGRMVFAKIEN